VGTSADDDISAGTHCMTWERMLAVPARLRIADHIAFFGCAEEMLEQMRNKHSLQRSVTELNQFLESRSGR
jgi:hypothetical protein